MSPVRDDEAILRGFDLRVPDIGDQMHFRQPLLAFRGSAALHVAGRVDWRGDADALHLVDLDEAELLATVFPEGATRRTASGAMFSLGLPLAGFRWGDRREVVPLTARQMGFRPAHYPHPVGILSFQPRG